MRLVPACCWWANPAPARRTWPWRPLRKILEKGFECLFCDYQNLLDRIRAGFDEASHSANKEAYQDGAGWPKCCCSTTWARTAVTDWVEDTITSIVTLPLQQPEAADRHHQRAGCRTPAAPWYRRTWRSTSPSTGAPWPNRLGARARSRLFEMCTVIRMPLVEDYRVRKGRQF